MLVTLSSLYRYAAEVGVVAKGFNPARNAVTRHKTGKKERFLTSEEMKRLADTLSDVEQKGLEWKLTPDLDPSRAKHRAKPDTEDCGIPVCNRCDKAFDVHRLPP